MTTDAVAPFAVLLVEDDPSFANWVETHLKLDFPQPISISRADNLRRTLRLLDEVSFDAILLDLTLPDSSGFDTFERVARASGRALVIVVTGTQDEGLAFKMLEEGAQDYLIKDNNLEIQTIIHSILWARPRHQLRVRLEEQSTEPTGVDADAPLPARLRARDPDAYLELATRYSRLLDSVISRWVHKSGDDLSEDVRGLAIELHAIAAGPRDILDLHAGTLKARSNAKPQAVLVTEGRLLALQLMGHLASAYRNAALRESLRR